MATSNQEPGYISEISTILQEILSIAREIEIITGSDGLTYGTTIIMN